MYSWTYWTGIALILLFAGIGSVYHLGWRKGWECGFKVGKQATLNDGDQPVPKSIFQFLYALGWHHGWDRGFRIGNKEVSE